MAFTRPKQTAQQFLNSLRAVPLYKHHETPRALLVSFDGIRGHAKWFPRRACEEFAGPRPELIVVKTEDWRLKQCELAGALYRPSLADHYSDEFKADWGRLSLQASEINRNTFRGKKGSSIPAGLVGGAYESFGA